MADVPGRLATARSDRYRIERRLGTGGMATGCLAQDLRHDRRPELAAVIGAEQYARTPAMYIVLHWFDRLRTRPTR